MKIQFVPLLFLALPASAELNWYMGASLSQIEQEFSFVKNFEGNEVEYETETLTALSQSIQLGASGENYSVTLSLGLAKEDDSWQASPLLNSAYLEQNSQELSYNYYLDEWSIGASYGQSEYKYGTNQMRTWLNNAIELSADNSFDSKDTFIEVSLGKWFDLSQFNENLAATIDVALTLYESKARLNEVTELVQNANTEQAANRIANINREPGVQNLERYDVDSEQTLFSVSGSLDYSSIVWEKETYFSLWGSYESSQGAQGQLVATRAGRSRAPIPPRTVDLNEDNSPIAQDDIVTIGIDATVNVTNDTSISASLIDNDVYSLQWQLSVFHNF